MNRSFDGACFEDKVAALAAHARAAADDGTDDAPHRLLFNWLLRRYPVALKRLPPLQSVAAPRTDVAPPNFDDDGDDDDATAGTAAPASSDVVLEWPPSIPRRCEPKVECDVLSLRRPSRPLGGGRRASRRCSLCWRWCRRGCGRR